MIAKTKEAKQSYDSLYQTYENTGVISDGLADSAKTMAEAVGVSGAEALIAAGKFHELNQEIEEGIDKQNQYNQQAIKERRDAVRGTIEQESPEDEWLYGQTQKVETKVREKTDKQKYYQDLIDQFTEQQNQLDTLASDYRQQYARYEALIKASQEKRDSFNLTEAEKELVDLDKQAATMAAERIKNNTDFNSFTNIDDIRKQFSEQADIKTLLDLNPEEGKAVLNQYLMEIAEGLDNSALAEAIEKQISEGTEKALSNFKDKYSDDQITEMIKEAGFEELPIDDFVNQFREIGGIGDVDASDQVHTLNEVITAYETERSELQKTLQTRAEDIEQLKKSSESYDANGKMTEKAAQKLSELEKELSDVNTDLQKNKNNLDTAQKTMKELAAASLQTDNAMVKLQKN